MNMKYQTLSIFMIVFAMWLVNAQEQVIDQEKLMKQSEEQSIAALKKEKEREKQQEQKQDAKQAEKKQEQQEETKQAEKKQEQQEETKQDVIPPTDNASGQQLVKDGVKRPVSLATMTLPVLIPEGYPIRIAVMDFITGAELMVGSTNVHPAIQSLAKVLSAKKNNTLSIPLGAVSLGIELQKLNSQLFSLVPGNNGGGFENLDALQEAVLGLGVTHVVFGVLSDIHHAEDANSGVHYGGIEVSRTIYSLDLNVIVYDIPRRRTVLADTYTAEIAENKPFNERNINRSMFETLLKDVCTMAARAIVEYAEDTENPNGIKPYVKNK